MYIYIYIYFFFFSTRLRRRDEEEKKSNRDFDGHTSVDSMLVIEIDTIHIEALQASLASAPHIRGITLNSTLAVADDDSEFGSYLNFVPHSSFKRLTQN